VIAPGRDSLERLERMAELRRENRQLRERIAQLQDELEVKDGHRLFIVPGMVHLGEAILSLTDANDGDVLRVAGTDFVMRRTLGVWHTEAGTTPIPPALSTPESTRYPQGDDHGRK
jgi:hypothetical protein